jgi:hypothetical protein
VPTANLDLSPNPSVHIFIPRDNLILMNVPLISKHKLSVHNDIPNRRAAKRENDEGQQVFCGMPCNGDVVQIDGNEIGARARQ